MSSHLVLWEVHQVLFNSKISCERTDFAGEMLVKCIISTPVCQIPRTNIRNTGRALQFSFQWWAINMCHYFWRGVHGFDTAVANCLPKRGLFFNFHDFCLLKNSSFLKIDTLSEKDPWDLRSVSAKSIGHFSSFVIQLQQFPFVISRTLFFDYQKYEYNPKVAGEAKKEWGESLTRMRKRTQIHGRIWGNTTNKLNQLK